MISWRLNRRKGKFGVQALGTPLRRGGDRHPLLSAAEKAAWRQALVPCVMLDNNGHTLASPTQFVFLTTIQYDQRMLYMPAAANCVWQCSAHLSKMSRCEEGMLRLSKTFSMGQRRSRQSGKNDGSELWGCCWRRPAWQEFSWPPWLCFAWKCAAVSHSGHRRWTAAANLTKLPWAATDYAVMGTRGSFVSRHS